MGRVRGVIRCPRIALHSGSGALSTTGSLAKAGLSPSHRRFKCVVAPCCPPRAGKSFAACGSAFLRRAFE
eukprot:4438209-Pyramimonas_sp.AAC.1